MKPCDDYTLALSAFVDGELNEEERAALLRHLTECEGCRAYLAELGAMRDAFGEMEEERAPEGFAEGVMARLHEEKRGARRSRKGWMGLAACAAVVLLAVSVLPGLTGQKKDAAAPMAQEEMVMSAPAEGVEDAAVLEPTNGPAAEAEEAPAESPADWGKTTDPAESAANDAEPEAAEEPVSVLVVYGEGAEEYLAAHAEGYTYDADGEPAEYILPPEELDELEEKLDELGLSYEEACLPDQAFHVQIVPGGEVG